MKGRRRGTVDSGSCPSREDQGPFPWVDKKTSTDAEPLTGMDSGLALCCWLKRAGMGLRKGSQGLVHRCFTAALTIHEKLVTDYTAFVWSLVG